MYDTKQILEEIGTVIKGKDEIIRKVFMAILAEGHVLLEDVPGVGKTTLALAFSKVLGTNFHRMQFTPDVMPADLVGFSMYNKESGKFEYQQGAVFCNLFLADEINRTSSKTQSALLEVMEEGQVTVDGVRHGLPSPFTVIATQNPAGGVGTQMLPQAQLDRFLIKLQMGYPDYEGQMELLRDRQTGNPLETAETKSSALQITKMQEEVRSIYTSEEILDYLTRLSMATRNNPMISLGISPRGTLALSKISKACAYLSGRDYVVPSDVQNVLLDTWAHRILLSTKARIEERSPQDVLQEILQEMPEVKKGKERKTRC